VSDGLTPPFVLKKVGGVAVVRLNGPKLDFEARESLYDLVQKQAIAKLVLNFEEVRILTSAPIGMLISLRKKAEAAAGSVRFCHVSQDIRDILRLTAVEALFPMFPAEQDAIDSFKRE
jgi:anti-sigma B factor antagonist